MSLSEDEILENLKNAYALFNRGDFDAAVELAHPDIEFVPPGGQPSFRGAKALRAWMEPDAFDSQEIHPLELTLSGNKVLVRLLTRARGSGSGIEIELLMWNVWTFDSDGLWIQVKNFLPHEEAEARSAAGLAD